MVNFVVKQNIIAYHTSDLTEPIDDLKDLTPFHSNVNEPQWLGQGYYFWTDDDFYAHLWGCLKIKNDEGISQYKYKNGYVITQFNISIEPNNLLDLVGNARQQIYFYKLTPLSTLYNSLILKGLKFNSFLAKNCKPSIYRALEKRVESQVKL